MQLRVVGLVIEKYQQPYYKIYDENNDKGLKNMFGRLDNPVLIQRIAEKFHVYCETLDAYERYCITLYEKFEEPENFEHIRFGILTLNNVASLPNFTKIPKKDYIINVPIPFDSEYPDYKCKLFKCKHSSYNNMPKGYVYVNTDNFIDNTRFYKTKKA